jgi:hypothetical protein
MPAGSMKIMAFMGRPVKYISRTCSRRSAASAPTSQVLGGLISEYRRVA